MRVSRILTGTVLTAAAFAAPMTAAVADPAVVTVNSATARPFQEVEVTFVRTTPECPASSVVESSSTAGPDFTFGPAVVGTATGKFTVRSTATAGDHTVTVTCQDNNRTFSGTFTVVRPDEPAPLPGEPGDGPGQGGSDPGAGADSGPGAGMGQGGDPGAGANGGPGAGAGQSGNPGANSGSGSDSSSSGYGGGDQGKHDDGGKYDDPAKHDDGGKHDEPAKPQYPGKQGYGQGHHPQHPHGGSHTGLGGSIGMDATETAVGAALITAVAGGGVYLLRRRARHGH